MKLFRTRYRIVTDTYLGYEAQFRYWWSPVWMQVVLRGECSNTSSTIEKAEAIIDQHKKMGVVKYVD